MKKTEKATGKAVAELQNCSLTTAYRRINSARKSLGRRFITMEDFIFFFKKR